MAASSPPTRQAMIDAFLADWPGWSSHLEALEHAVALIVDAARHDSLILTCGNGGSAADSNHIAAELVKAFRRNRPIDPGLSQSLAKQMGPAGQTLAARLQGGLRAVSLAASPANLTALANDCGQDLIFAQQIVAIGRAGDVLIALSTSGNSANIVKALEVAHAAGMRTLGLTGQNDGAMDPLCDILLKAPATQTHRIQEYHLASYHLLCGLIEHDIFAT